MTQNQYLEYKSMYYDYRLNNIFPENDFFQIVNFILMIVWTKFIDNRIFGGLKFKIYTKK